MAKDVANDPPIILWHPFFSGTAAEIARWTLSRRLRGVLQWLCEHEKAQPFHRTVLTLGFSTSTMPLITHARMYTGRPVELKLSSPVIL